MTLTAYYDLHCSPPTYDIVAFLLAAERWRARCASDKIAISVLPGSAGGFRPDKFWPFGVEQRTRMLHQVALPMARMLPNLSELTVRRDRVAQHEPKSIGLTCRLYGTRLFLECIREGIRPLRPHEDLKLDHSLVTITLREAEHWEPRNSNIPEWIAAAKEIERRGYRVVIVRDTLRAGEPLEDLTINKSAAWDLIARAQLYRSAACNLFVNNGPAWFAMALDAPVLMVKPTVEGLMRTCSESYFRECGLAFGTQIDESVSYQHIAWCEDTCAEILTAFDKFEAVNIRQREVA
jgi:hypothetical protein